LGPGRPKTSDLHERKSGTGRCFPPKRTGGDLRGGALGGRRKARCAGKEGKFVGTELGGVF